MSVMNVGMKDVQSDGTYRYKMEKIQTKIEGRGNGIKTVLLNIANISRGTGVTIGMRTSPEYVTKYLGTECGASSIWDKKRDVGIVNGVHEPEALQQYLFGFMDFFILCPTCRLPELKHKFKSSKVSAKCFGCGWKGKIQSGHKVMKYIIKNPMKTKIKTQIPKAGPGKLDNLDGPMKETPEGEFDFKQWHVDKDKSPMHEERKIEKDLQMKMIENFSNEELNSPLALLRFILNRPGVSLVEMVSEFQRIRLAHQLDNAELKLAKILVDAVFDFTSIATIMASIDRHKDFLSYYTNDKTCAFFLISYMEEEIVVKNILDQTPFILEKFYDCDVFNEDFLVEWFNRQPEDSYILQDREDVLDVKRHAEPFVNWCKQYASIGQEEEETAI